MVGIHIHPQYVAMGWKERRKKSSPEEESRVHAEGGEGKRRRASATYGDLAGMSLGQVLSLYRFSRSSLVVFLFLPSQVGAEVAAAGIAGTNGHSVVRDEPEEPLDRRAFDEAEEEREEEVSPLASLEARTSPLT